MPSSIHKPSRDAVFLELFESGGSLPAAATDDPESQYSEYREIGHGNFGSVFYALENSTNEVVAVKKMSIASTNSLKDSKQKYEDVCREIRMLKTLAQHPNLLAFRRAHYDTKQGLILLVTEYCLGSCADVLETLHEIEEREIAAVVSQCLAGLAFVHSRGAIHRDVKASNILIGERGVVKLADFGSASGNPMANSFVGTPFWIAPEVILAMDTGQYDARADVWSLGVTCHELVDGRPPYFSLNPMSALYQIAHNEPPQLPARRKARSDSRRAGLLRTTHQDDRRRFDTPDSSAESHSQSDERPASAGRSDSRRASEDDRDADDMAFSDEFRDFVARCMQKDVARRPRSDWLLAQHAFVLRDEVQATRVTQELLDRTRRALSEADPQKHRRIRENFNTESGGAPVRAFDDVFAAQLLDRRASASAIAPPRALPRTQDPETLLSNAISELDAMQLQLRRFSTAATTLSSQQVPAPQPPHPEPDDGDFIQFTASADSDGKFATLKTKRMLRRELEESQKYVSIREKFAALKRLRTVQQKEVRSLELRCDTELHDLRIRLARAREDAKRDAAKEASRLDERQRTDSERRERDISAAWKRASAALQKLRKRTLNAASSAKFGSLGKARAANRSAVDTVSSAETHLKVLERLNLLALHKFAQQNAGECRARRELALADDQRLVQLHIEEIENAQLSRIDSIYRAKLAHLERLFELERENHAAFFRSESDKLVRSHERLAKELAKARKLADAGCKRDADSISRANDKDLRDERVRIDTDYSLSKAERDNATRSAKDRFERRRADELSALRRRVDDEQAAAALRFQHQCDTETRQLAERARDEFALLTRGQQVARSNLDAERAAELESARRNAANNQRDRDAQFAAERDELRRSCDADAAALRDSQRRALRDFDARASADLSAMHCALLAAGASQYSSTANLQNSGTSAASQQPAFCQQLYALHCNCFIPRDVDALSAADTYELVLREVERYCFTDHAASLQLLSSYDPQLATNVTDVYSGSETSSSVDTSSVNSSTLERANPPPPSAAPQPSLAPAAVTRVKKMSLGASQQPSPLARAHADAANNGVNVRLRNDPQSARAVDSRAKRNSMVVLSASHNLSAADHDHVPYDYNGAMPRGIGAHASTPPKTVGQLPGSASSSQLSNWPSTGYQAPAPAPPPPQARAIWPPSLATHHPPQAAPAVLYGARASSGSSGSAGLQRGSTNGSSGSGSASPSPSPGGSSRQSASAVSQVHRRRLFGVFGSSHNVNDNNQTTAPNSDSIPANLNVNVNANANVPRNRHSMNIGYAASTNWSLSNTQRSNDANDQSEI